ELGEANVVTNRHAELVPAHLGDDGLLARRARARLFERRAVRQIDVEQMNLAIAREERPVRREERARVEGARVVAALLRHAAGDDEDAFRSRELGDRFRDGTLARGEILGDGAL